MPFESRTADNPTSNSPGLAPVTGGLGGIDRRQDAHYQIKAKPGVRTDIELTRLATRLKPID